MLSLRNNCNEKLDYQAYHWMGRQLFAKYILCELHRITNGFCSICYFRRGYHVLVAKNKIRIFLQWYHHIYYLSLVISKQKINGNFAERETFTVCCSLNWQETPEEKQAHTPEHAHAHTSPNKEYISQCVPKEVPLEGLGLLRCVVGCVGACACVCAWAAEWNWYGQSAQKH